MKKVMFCLVCLFCTGALFAGNPVTVKSGDVSVLKGKNKALLEFDYSATKVGDKTLDEYLKDRGEDFVRDWPNDKIRAASYFVERFNKKNKKGMQITSDEEAAGYTVVVHVKTLDMGNGGSAFVPFSSAKAGGVIMTGTIDIVDKNTQNVVCNLYVDEVKGLGHVSEAIRIGLAYFALADKMYDLVK